MLHRLGVYLRKVTKMIGESHHGESRMYLPMKRLICEALAIILIIEISMQLL